MERPSPAGRWLGRNAKWFVPLSAVTFVVLAAAGVFQFLHWFDGYMRGLPPFRMAMQELRSHQEGSELLGAPIQSEGQVHGDFNISSRFSNAQLSIPVQGSRAKGTLLVNASATGEDWRLNVVTLETANPKRRIRIIEPHSPP